MLLSRLKTLINDERGVSEWIGVVVTLSLITLTILLVVNLRTEWIRKDLFNEVVLSVKNEFELSGGLTSDIEDLIIDRLNSAEINYKSVNIEGSPISNYGATISYKVRIVVSMKLGDENHDKEYIKKVYGTSHHIPSG